MDGTKKLPTWGKGCQESGKIADAIYEWSLKGSSLTTLTRRGRLVVFDTNVIKISLKNQVFL